MSAEHVIPGFDDPTCGIAVAAKQLMRRGVGEDGEVWVHSMWLPMVVKASLKTLLTGRKLVRMPHGCTDPTKLKHHWHKKRWVALIERWIFRHADRIIATCEDEVDWIKAFEPKVRKVEFVPLSSPAPQPSPVRHRLDEGGSLRLLYVGRLHKLKGLEFLFEALPSDVKLVIIGKEDGEGAKLREIAKRRGLDVEFRGVVSEDEKIAAYDACDALVLPTLSENFGLVIAEALERGCRVITTDGAPAWGDGNTYGGRLVYLKGYLDGSREERIALLEDAIRRLRSERRGECVSG